MPFFTNMETKIKSNKKFWKPPSVEDFNVSLPNKKIKLDTDNFYEEDFEKIPSEPNEPKNVSELAIHPKKIGEIRNWIASSRKEKAPVLLVTGPAGCGKTITLKVSAKEEGFVVKEWINPTDKTEYKTEPVFQHEEYDRFNFSEAKQVDKFDDFIFRSSRYKSLFEEEENFLILVEDIPNIFVWNPKLFYTFLEKYKNNGKSPIVFLVTDDQNLNLSNSLFPNHIKSKYCITNIKFNPVNHSSLIKNLKNFSEIYCSEKVSSQFLEDIVKSSAGDLRSARNDLILFLRTSALCISPLQKKAKKTKKNENLGSGCKPLCEKDSSFDFYHLLGRILYPKLMSEEEKAVCKNPHRIFLHDVQQIAEGWNNSFLNILHGNYLQTFTMLKDVVEGAECFSFCDVFSQCKELEEYLSLTGVITLMIKNTKPKKTGFNPLKRSFRFEPNPDDDDTELGDQLYGCQLRRRDFLLDVNPFLKILDITKDQWENSAELLSQVNEDCNESEGDLIEIEEIED